MKRGRGGGGVRKGGWGGEENPIFSSVMGHWMRGVGLGWSGT